MGARRYGPDTTRFLQQDIFYGALANLGLSLDPLTQNPYTLASGNPISYIEIDGHMTAVITNGAAAPTPDPDSGCPNVTCATPTPRSVSSGTDTPTCGSADSCERKAQADSTWLTNHCPGTICPTSSSSNAPSPWQSTGLPGQNTGLPGQGGSPCQLTFVLGIALPCFAQSTTGIGTTDTEPRGGTTSTRDAALSRLLALLAAAAAAGLPKGGSHNDEKRQVVFRSGSGLVIQPDPGDSRHCYLRAPQQLHLDWAATKPDANTNPHPLSVGIRSTWLYEVRR
jgi:hypothetical protein